MVNLSGSALFVVYPPLRAHSLPQMVKAGGYKDGRPTILSACRGVYSISAVLLLLLFLVGIRAVIKLNTNITGGAKE